MIRDPGYFEKMGSESEDPDPQNSHMDPDPRIRDPWIFFLNQIRDPDPTYCRITDPSLGSYDPSDLTDLGS